MFNSIKTSCKTMFCLQNKKEEMGELLIQKKSLTHQFLGIKLFIF